MKENFEQKLIVASSPEIFKRGKKILKANNLICAYKDHKGGMHAVFTDSKENVTHCVVKSDDSNTATCDCNQATKSKLCEHAIATVLYLSRFQDDNTPYFDDPPKFAGLKFKSFDELSNQALVQPEAYVTISAESSFPHVPSKFEHAVLKVRIVYNGKDYAGNISNIRQLQFGKTMAAALKMNHFSQQDRQVIRFLAINAEPEGASLQLDSEQTAEFFHCLNGFEHFYKNGKKVIIHRETADAILLYKRKGAEYLLRPALRINGGLLPLKTAKVITGRAGCWVGFNGEYWWIPANVDVSWLRGFLRTSEQRCDGVGFKKLHQSSIPFPFEIVNCDKEDVESRECLPVYSCYFNQEKHLELELAFSYDGTYVPGNGMRLGCADGEYWQRDEVKESTTIAELEIFGFKHIKTIGKRSIFIMENDEAAGVFMDEVVMQWQNQFRNFLMSGRFAKLSSGGRGVPLIDISCFIAKSSDSNYKLIYHLGFEKLKISWKDLFKDIKKGKNYFISSGRILKISQELKRFMSAVNDIIHHVSGETNMIQIPRHSAPFWANTAKDFPNAVPEEFLQLKGVLISSKENESNNNSLRQSDLPFHGDLRNYQAQGVEWLHSMTSRGFNVVLADEMGLGKTIQTLALLSENLSNDDSPAIIVCPTSLSENWFLEAQKFVPDMKVLNIKGANRNRMWTVANDYNLLIISYSIAKRDIAFYKKMTFSYVILDEAQHIKNPTTANSKACKEFKAHNRMVLTGTPLENSPDDLWSIFDFLHPNILGSFNSFKKHYTGINKNKELQQELVQRVNPFILRRKKADVCTELPPKQTQVIYCEMSTDQRKLYDEVFARGKEKFTNLLTQKQGKPSFEMLTILLRLRQICCHPGLLKESEGPSVLDVSSAKLDLLKELVLENIDSGHKMLLFSQFTSLLSFIREWLDEEKIKYEYLDGSTKDRQKRVDNFNKSKSTKLFLLSLKAGGTGLNLTSADTVIIYDPWWNPAVEAQAMDRTHRIGQTRSVTNMKLVVKDSIEEKILELQEKKQKLFDNLIENPSEVADKLSLKDLEDIFLK